MIGAPKNNALFLPTDITEEPKRSTQVTSRAIMKFPIKGIFITERDIEFFKYLHAVKIATYDQVHRDNYSDYKIDSVDKRIRKMENNGILKPIVPEPYLMVAF